jgi:hypothetical protein
MSLKDAYHQKMEAQLEEQQARLELLKAKAKRALAEGKIIAYEELADAEQKMAAAKGHLKNLAHSSEAAFKEMKGGMESAWHELWSACQNAAKQYKDKEPTPPTPAPDPANPTHVPPYSVPPSAP